MTPKEKAKKLVSNFSSKLPFYTQKDNLIKSKKCALLAVDEVLNELPEDSIDYGVSARIRFFEEVKQEIENL